MRPQPLPRRAARSALSAPMKVTALPATARLAAQGTFRCLLRPARDPVAAHRDRPPARTDIPRRFTREPARRATSTALIGTTSTSSSGMPPVTKSWGAIVWAASTIFCPKWGADGLYTSTLFKFKPVFATDGACAGTRPVVRAPAEYQGQAEPLGAALARHREYLVRNVRACTRSCSAR